MASVSQDFVSIGCNRVAGCAAWSLGGFSSGAAAADQSGLGLVAYGANNFVCLFSAKVRPPSRCCACCVQR